MLLQVESMKHAFVSFFRFFLLTNKVYTCVTFQKNKTVPFNCNFRYIKIWSVEKSDQLSLAGKLQQLSKLSFCLFRGIVIFYVCEVITYFEGNCLFTVKTNSTPSYVTAILEEWYLVSFFEVIELMMVVFYRSLPVCNNLKFAPV